MSISVVSVAQMREWEAASWAAGRTEGKVIERVGELIAKRLSAMVGPGQTVLCLAGKGHNGDDVRAAVPHMPAGMGVLLEVTNPFEALASLRTRLSERPALILDGIFGIGLNRPLGSDWSELISEINRSGVPLVAVDVPSGLNAETGEAAGTACVADLTLTLGAPKTGLINPCSASHVGRLEVIPEIGLIPCPFAGECQWTLPEDFTGYPPARKAESHKGNYGHLVVVAGSMGYHGAAVLAGRGAQKSCPGLITLLTDERVYLPVAAQAQAVMVQPWTAALAWPKSCTAVVFGPGLASPLVPAEMQKAMRAVWRDQAHPVVADATGLDWLPPGPTVREIRVISPHPGEAARLLGVTTEKVQENRRKAVRELSRRYGDCWVVLKGRQTLVGRSTGDIYINPSGNPGLAQGGSGDVLAGYLGGLLAQPRLQDDPLKALRFGVWSHGAAADAQGTGNWTIEEFVQKLGPGRKSRMEFF